jgi:hypothetical protein
VRETGGAGVVAAVCISFLLGALTLLAFTLATRADSGDFFILPPWVSAAELPAEVEIRKSEYLVRPEAPTVGVNVVKPLHRRAPVTDAEAAEWVRDEEMVAVAPGTAVKRIEGDPPGYAVCVEVIEGPRKGLRGWVWEDTLRDERP